MVSNEYNHFLIVSLKSLVVGSYQAFLYVRIELPATSRACFRFCKYGNNPDALRRFVLIFKDSSGDFNIYFARSCPLFSGGSLLYYGDNIPAIIFFDLLCLWSSVCFGDTTRPFRCLLIGFRFDFFVCLSFSLM